ncbi:mRNA cap guanine-N7 methyltransferase [Neocucurbitaria cava]|uniref:mRNA cap guanine-N(7) methyltransferase n=1 Tax=Neocucurbitaria cava TaxID=798079 RepID=A0A9W8YH61_9PLEO|nr:mRNA cap guanine-N7 methyltransferase [Neocucurbitaria cava]
MAGPEQGTKRTRSMSRSPSRSRSPPRQRKRPGAGARLSAADREAARKRQQEREQEAERRAQNEAAQRGVHDVVKQHYNMVPERGREWRQTDSKIKGLRSFNNWVKSSIIQKFIGDERNLRILDIGCGKGGDLQKWQAARKVELYVGCDPADVSIKQAKDRYAQMQRKSRRIFHAEFYAKDCFGEWLGDIPIIKEVGIDPAAGPGNAMSQRWGGGGWDMVTMMFCMHYAFESEAKAKGMLRNVSGALKKGGRFIGCIPNSDVLTGKVIEHHKSKGTAPAETNGAGDDEEDDRPTFASDDEDDWDPEKSLDSPKPDESEHANGDTKDEVKDKKKEKEKEEQEDGEVEEEGFGWGNSIYRVKFPGKTPPDGVFRPPYGWKYSYFLTEAVEAPEYVVPWEAFRALAEDYNLELQYRKPFREVWDEQKDDPELGPLSERMGVRDRATGRLLTTEEELDAADFYHTFCFYKV